jgi:hypothetical protein
MPGMPSARGIEWKTDGHSHERFEQGFDNVPRDPVTGKWIIEPPRQPEPEVKRPPESCGVCGLKEDCSVECAHGSQECREKLGI